MLSSDPSVGGGSSGDFKKFIRWVGMWIEQPVVIDVQDPPQGRISWHYNLEGPYTDEERREAKDAQLVLKNITHQTGLTFRKEKRDQRVIVLEQRK